MTIIPLLTMALEKTYIDEEGYLRFLNSKKLVHRWVVEKELGRKLISGEIIHHIDYNKLNNDIKNLFLCEDQALHEKIHYIDGRRYKGAGVHWARRQISYQYESDDYRPNKYIRDTIRFLLITVAVLLAIRLFFWLVEYL